MSERKALLGKLQPGLSVDEQIQQVFGAPWHVMALVNGAFAAAALLFGAVALILAVLSPHRRPVWITAGAVAGLVLGLLGAGMAGAMYFDVFTDLPAITAPH